MTVHVTTLRLEETEDGWRATQRGADVVGRGDTAATAAANYCLRVAGSRAAEAPVGDPTSTDENDRQAGTATAAASSAMSGDREPETDALADGAGADRAVPADEREPITDPDGTP